MAHGREPRHPLHHGRRPRDGRHHDPQGHLPPLDPPRPDRLEAHPQQADQGTVRGRGLYRADAGAAVGHRLCGRLGFRTRGRDDRAAPPPGGAVHDRPYPAGKWRCHPDGLGEDPHLDSLHEETAMSGRRWSLLIAALAIPTELPAQSGQFLVRLGRDTLALERYTRTADRLEGEQVARRARAAATDRYTVTMLPLGTNEPWSVEVNRIGADSLTIQLGPIGPLRMRVDDRGTLLGVSGAGSTMQVTVERVQGLDFAALGKSFAPRSLGTLSPADSVRASVAGAAVTVRYSRPSVRGRVIFGNVVPWNKVWRTGANEATVLETNGELSVAGTTVPAGKYSLWTIPGPAGWKLVINRNTGQWGTDYDARYDLARLDMKVEPLRQPVEQFTIAIEPSGKGGVLKLDW